MSIVCARRTLVIAALALVGCSNQVVLPASTPTSNAVMIRINATTSTMPLMSELTRRYAQVNPRVSFDVSSSNYQVVSAAAIGSEPIYFLTNYLPPMDESSLWGAPIGQDAIVIVTFRSNLVGNLTTEQIRAIFQGRMTNWAMFGEDPLPITVISREAGAGMRAAFDRLVMGERQTSLSAHIAPSSAAVVASVARQPGSIGYVSMGYVDSSVQTIHVDGIAPTIANVYQNAYPLRTTLFFAGPDEPQDANLRAFIAWVQSPDGQAIVGRRYTPLLLP